jgi:arginine utilization protein RocB
VDYQAIRDLDVPIINIGPFGHDAHKKYERVDVGYSMYIVPNLTNLVIKGMLVNHDDTAQGGDAFPLRRYG